MGVDRFIPKRPKTHEPKPKMEAAVVEIMSTFSKRFRAESSLAGES